MYRGARTNRQSENIHSICLLTVTMSERVLAKRERQKKGAAPLHRAVCIQGKEGSKRELTGRVRMFTSPVSRQVDGVLDGFASEGGDAGPPPRLVHVGQPALQGAGSRHGEGGGRGAAPERRAARRRHGVVVGGGAVCPRGAPVPVPVPVAPARGVDVEAAHVQAPQPVPEAGHARVAAPCRRQ